ncbi:hypothetical protein ACHWQZ_G002306 [Mnemiopsis leidyi]
MARTFETPEQLQTYVREKMEEEMGKLPLPCKKPAKFVYGTSFRDYVSGWSNYADVIKIPDPSKYASLNTFLDEQSQVIATGLALSEEQKRNWNEARESLIKVLDKYVSKSAMKKQFVKSCQQSKESIAEYGARVSRLFNNAFDGKGDADLLCSVFLNGLKSDTIAIQMAAYEPQPQGTDTRFHAILKQAQELESAISSRVTEPASAQSEVLQLSTNSLPKPQPEGSSSLVNTNQQDMAHQQRPHFQARPQGNQFPWQQQYYPSTHSTWNMQTPRPTINSGQMQNNRSFQPRQNLGPICYGCGNSGHIQRSCPMSLPNQAQCFGCGRYGHTIRQCRTTANQRNGYNPLSSHNRPHPVSQGNIRLPQQYHTRNPAPNSVNRQYTPRFQRHVQFSNGPQQSNDTPYAARFRQSNRAGPSSVHIVEDQQEQDTGSYDQVDWDEWGPYPVSELANGKLKTAETGIKLKGVTGAELKVVGVIALDIKVNKLQVNCEFVVVDSKMDYPILGIPFISGNRLIIDYDSNQIYDKTGRFHSNLTSASAVNKVSELKEEEEQLTGQARVDEIIRLLDLSNSTLKPDQIKRVESLITEYNHVFALYRSEVSFTNLVEHTIPLTSEEIVRCKYRPVPIHAIDDCIKEIDVLLRRGVIERSESEYSSPVVIVKRNNKFRICVDYRSLNKISGASRAAVPALNTLTATFHGTKVFFSLDCREAFYQVKIKEEHRHRTAWTIPSIGHFQQVSMSLGLRGAPATMQSLLDKTIEGMRESVVGYVDDLAGGAEDNEKLILILEELFKRLSIANLRLHPAKCRLFASQISFLGVILSSKGIEVDPKKVEAIQHMTLPKTRKMMMSLIGSFNWFRNLIDHFSDLIKPLVDTLKPERFSITKEAEENIKVLKEKLLKSPILIYPIPEETIHVITDCSGYCMGGAIGHVINDQFHPIAYNSKILSPAEQNYPTFKRELLAIKTFVTHWRFYTVGKPFIVSVDHKPITEEKFLRKTNCKVLLSWILELEEYDFEIRYLPGNDMGLVDGLSRLPSKRDKLFSWWESNFSKSLTSESRVPKPANRMENNQTSFSQEDKTPQDTVTAHITETPEVQQVLLTTDTSMASQPDIKTSVHSDATDTNHHSLGTFENPIINFNDSQGKWKAVQEEDMDIKTACQWLTNNVTPSKSEGAAFNNELRKLLSKKSQLHLHNGLLCYKWLGSKGVKYKLLIWVPASQRSLVMRNHHDIEASGHLGPAKMLERVRKQLYWPDMRLEITLYCQTCEKCFMPNLAYKPNPKSALKPFTAVRHNQIVCMDLIGPISRVNKYKWCLTMIDKFTHYLEVDPLEDATSPTIAKSLINTWITKHGVMEQLLTDQGSNIDKSKVINEVYSTLQVGKIRTSPYKPSTNGLAENANKQIKICLTKYVLEHPDTWPDKLKIIAFAYNTSQNKSTKFSPHFLLHGQEARVPNDLVFGTTSSEYYKTQAHLASKTYYSIKEAWDFALKNIGNLQMQQKRYYDKTAKPCTYEVGDRVLIYLNRPMKGTELNKFKPPYTGPYKVTKVMDVNLELADEATGKKKVVHMDKARKIPNNLRSPAEELGEEERSQNSNTNLPVDRSTDEDSDSSEDDDLRLRQRLSSQPQTSSPTNRAFHESTTSANDDDHNRNQSSPLGDQTDQPHPSGRTLRNRTTIREPERYQGLQ